MRKKLLFIYNPTAGKNQIREELSDILREFVKAGYESTVYPTEKPKDAMNLTEELSEGYDLLVCSGGDGTLNEVTNGMMKRNPKCPIGYIPAGTTNDFAQSLKLSKDMVEAAKVAVSGSTFPCDIGLMNRKYFNYFAGFGAFTNVSWETSQASKNLFGRMAYILEGVKNLPNLKTYHITVSAKGEEITGEFIYGMITNSDSIGGFKKLAGKEVLLNDGLFEVLLLYAPKNPLDLQALINNLLTGEVDPRRMISLRTEELQIISEKKIAWTIDGEFGGIYNKVAIENIKQAIEYVKERELPEID